MAAVSTRADEGVPAGYVGRFAPSPTGALHLGSLASALGSYLDARSAQGVWRVRIEDLDTARNVPGADTQILRTLERLGLHWDGPVLRQSDRLERYAEALERLGAHTYGCGCSRAELGPATAAGERRYSGRCRDGLGGRPLRAIRVRVAPGPTVFTDAVNGRHAQTLSQTIGDFVLKRADGPFAYQLAVVVDDAEQGVTDVVRGADLLASTARQIYLQGLLGYRQPRYLHLPLVLGPDGQKLSKQTGAAALAPGGDAAALRATLAFLGHAPPRVLDAAGCAELLEWGVQHWSRARIPRAARATSV
jgi:glutamyl-Q tRNA(Asp) synthetase